MGNPAVYMIRPLTPTFGFWAWSKFNIFANFDPLKTNDSALECLIKANPVWAFQQGANTITKNNYLLRANRQ